MYRNTAESTMRVKLKMISMIICSSFAISLIWLQLITAPDFTNRLPADVVKSTTHQNEGTRQEETNIIFPVSLSSPVNKNINNLTKDLKYLLLWTEQKKAPFYFFGEGRQKFHKLKCLISNCYVTTDRTFFNGDVTRFDAIAFNGRSLNPGDLPKQRSPHQKYIYFNMESADNFPVCHSEFDGFFNWTSTYKLNSDIPFPYLLIKKNGTIVGPKIYMQWPNEMLDVKEEFTSKLRNKTKAAAWFVSHCRTNSKREMFVQSLQRALARYGHSIDVYGACGTFKCSKKKTKDCNAMVEKDYYFYMSLENSFADDYVTEKLLTALQHNLVPIVYGGVNYTRFLPPGSYLNARKLSVYSLAARMDKIIRTPSMYQQFFRWKQMYTYSDPTRLEHVCSVCEALNTKANTITEYKHFREWWYPNYKNRCEF